MRALKDLLKLLQLFKPYLGWMSLGVLLSYITLIANVGLMGISGWFIASMAAAGVAGVSMNYFTPAAIIRFFAIVRTAGRYGERLVTHEATLRLLAQLRSWFYRHLEPLAPARLQTYHSGDLLSRIRSDIDTLDNFYLRILVPVLVAVLGGITLFLFLSAYHIDIALINLGFLLLAGVGIPVWVRRMGQVPGRRMVATRAEMRARVVDALQGMSELTLYGAAEQHARQIAELSRRLASDQGRMSRYAGISQGALGLSANLSLWSIVIIAVPLIGAQALQAVDLAMLSLLTLASFEAVMPLPFAFQSLGETLRAARRIFEIAEAEPPVRDPDRPSPIPPTFDLEIKGLVFAYSNDRAPALNGIDLHLPSGGKVGIIGATGAGKSTLVNLLLRFWDPDQGQILLGGHDLRAFAADDLRRHIAVVSQHTHLFNTSIRENLLLANPAASESALEQACRKAEIHDFITQQPDGYDTWVGEAGLKISGGQARRIAIARALLKDAPLLILDEPTEDLDARTERAMLGSVMQLMEGRRTVVLITHRLAGLSLMDSILVLDRGRVVEQGTHEQLLTAGGHYQDLIGFLRELRDQ